MRLFLILAVAAVLASPAVSQEAFPGWTRVQQGNRLTSTMPDLTLEVDARLTPLEPLVFPIEIHTLAERRHFVETGPDGRITRMVIVQYEHAQSGSDFRFVFPSRPPVQFGAQTYRGGTFMSDESRSVAADAAREPARTHAFLAAKGYVPPAYWDIARLARVSDPKGLTEVIIFYMEASDGPRPGVEVDPEDGSATLPPERAAELMARLHQAVKPLVG